MLNGTGLALCNGTVELLSWCRKSLPSRLEASAAQRPDAIARTCRRDPSVEGGRSKLRIDRSYPRLGWPRCAQRQDKVIAALLRWDSDTHWSACCQAMCCSLR